jgi:hypothetical protein
VTPDTKRSTIGRLFTSPRLSARLRLLVGCESDTALTVVVVVVVVSVMEMLLLLLLLLLYCCAVLRQNCFTPKKCILVL